MLTGIGEPGPVRVQYATQNFFDLVGVQPVLGRVFRTEESQEQFQTVVISNAFWKRRFNSDPNVLGKTFRIDGVVLAVVGVMPAGFTGFAPWYSSLTEPTEVWKPVNVTLKPGRPQTPSVKQPHCKALRPLVHARRAPKAGSDRRASAGRDRRDCQRHGASVSRVQ